MQELELPAASPTARTEASPGAKSRVQDAAIESFSQKGRSGARIDDIVRLSKVNVRMIYHYFGSKDGLYDGMLAEIYNSRAAFIRGAKSDSTDWTLAHLIKALISWQASEPSLSRILDWEACEDWEGSRAAIEADVEAPLDLAPRDYSESAVVLLRKIHVLASPWARIFLDSSEGRELGSDRLELLISDFVKCFAAEEFLG